MSRLSVILGQVRTGKVLSGMVVVVPWSRVVGHDLAMTHTVVERLRICDRLEPELLHPSYLSITIRNHAFPYHSLIIIHEWNNEKRAQGNYHSFCQKNEQSVLNCFKQFATST